MNKIILPSDCNYIGIFLTFRCNMECSYCVVHHGKFKMRRSMTTKRWIKALARIPSRKDLPITLQGGECTLHPGFYPIVNSLRDGEVDLLTNGKFNVYDFLLKVRNTKFKRRMKYASIRFSIHSLTSVTKILSLISTMQNRGYEVGAWYLGPPAIYFYKREVLEELTTQLSIDLRMKDFLGFFKEELYGKYVYPEGVGKPTQQVICRSSELLVAPDGYVFGCHADLYAARSPIGHILDSKLEIGKERACSHFGACNPCDLKLKNNRFQEGGHCAVKIRGVLEFSSSLREVKS